MAIDSCEAAPAARRLMLQVDTKACWRRRPAWLGTVPQSDQPSSQVEPVQVFGIGTIEARVTSKVEFKVSRVLVDRRVDVG